MQKRAAKFANNINDSSWETLAQRRLIARICTLFDSYTVGMARKVGEERILIPCYLSREGYNRKIRARKQITDFGKYSFVNRTIKSWNLLPLVILVSFSCQINTFRKMVRNVVIRQGIQVGIKCKQVK